MRCALCTDPPVRRYRTSVQHYIERRNKARQYGEVERPEGRWEERREREASRQNRRVPKQGLCKPWQRMAETLSLRVPTEIGQTESHIRISTGISTGTSTEAQRATRWAGDTRRTNSTIRSTTKRQVTLEDGRALTETKPTKFNIAQNFFRCFPALTYSQRNGFA